MVVLIISLVYITKILYLSYLVWGKINITKFKRVRKEQFATKEKISSKKKKVNQERDKVTYIKEKEENYKMITAMKNDHQKPKARHQNFKWKKTF